MSDPDKENFLSACDKFSCGVVFTLKYNFRSESDPIPKECKDSCWESCERRILQVLCSSMFDSLFMC